MIDVIFSDDSNMPNMPVETPEQAAEWALEKEAIKEECRAYLVDTPKEKRYKLNA